MERAVYAVFQDRSTARGAMDALVREGVPEEVMDVQLHTGELDVEELPVSATDSRRYIKIGTPVVALVGALVGGLTAGWVGALLGILFAAVLGGIAAALSGSIDANPKVRHLDAPIDRGRTVLIVDTTGAREGLDCKQFLEQHGALRVGVT